MRAIVRALIVFLSTALIGCASTPQTPPSRQRTAELEADIVALVRLDDEGKSRMYCAGVFVSPTVILTAEHCVGFLGADAQHLMLHALGLDDAMPRWNPIGQVARFSTQSSYLRGAYWTGKVIGDDYDNDLGAILIDVPVPEHPYARLSTSDIYAGDVVYAVGHPGNYTWSYIQGVVSSFRPQEINGHGRPMPTLQIAGAFTYGFSGGGAFDSSGNLIGIGSYIDGGAPGMGFFVHRDVIRTFLASLKH